MWDINYRDDLRYRHAGVAIVGLGTAIFLRLYLRMEGGGTMVL